MKAKGKCQQTSYEGREWNLKPACEFNLNYLELHLLMETDKGKAWVDGFICWMGRWVYLRIIGSSYVCLWLSMCEYLCVNDLIGECPWFEVTM